MSVFRWVFFAINLQLNAINKGKHLLFCSLTVLQGFVCKKPTKKINFTFNVLIAEYFVNKNNRFETDC